MKFRATGSQDSFVAWGAGLRYTYEGQGNVLSVADMERQRVFAQLSFDRHLRRDPERFVQTLEKTSQIKALMYSNNASINIAEVIHPDRIPVLMEIVFKISRYAFDLSGKHYERFAQFFSSDFDLKLLKIKKFTSRSGESEYFIGRIQTRNDNAVLVRGYTLPTLIAALSDSTLSELILREFGLHHSNITTQTLLNMSSKLATISRVLDENFVPERVLSLKLENTTNDDEQAINE